MIYGGTSAAGKTANIRTGYTQKFIPCQLYLLDNVIQRRLELNKNLTWNAYVQVEDQSGNLLTIDEVSYFQVQKHLTGNIETASLTIEKPYLWGIWGNSYPEVLRPSKRKLKIYAGFPGKEMLIYTGRISSVADIRGSEKLGALNINCSDFRAILKKEESSQTGLTTTRYYEIYRLTKDVFESADQMVVISDRDAIAEFLPTGDKYEATNQAITGQPAWSMGGGTVVVCGNRQQNVIGNVLKLTDAHINYATRSFGDSTAYNVVNVMGLPTGEDEAVQQEVIDAADIAKRGRVVYPQLIGSEVDSLPDMISFAQEIIARSLLGSFSITVHYMPYLLPGQIVHFTSNNFNISPTYSRIQSIRHQYQHGLCATSFDSFELIYALPD
ncbi:MAG: hypothetical protein BWY14_01214 [Parcubacteria group bacterium ADurb.Bin192]|nr:MAG: hypothetical protein BWY14_01214 [Parcubacteria group bacterium ADurb.Bin192]